MWLLWYRRSKVVVIHAEMHFQFGNSSNPTRMVSWSHDYFLIDIPNESSELVSTNKHSQSGANRCPERARMAAICKVVDGGEM